MVAPAAFAVGQSKDPRVRTLQRKVNVLNTRVSALESSMSSLQQQVQPVPRQVQSLQSNLNEAQFGLSSLTSDEADLRLRTYDLCQQIEELSGWTLDCPHS